MKLRGPLLLCVALGSPWALRATNASRDTLQVLRLLNEARQASNNSILGYVHDSTLSARALALAERIGWERGIFKGHLWCLLSISDRNFRPDTNGWTLHLGAATQRRVWSSTEELVVLYRTLGKACALFQIPEKAALYIDTAQWAAERSADERLLALTTYTRAHSLRIDERWADAFRMALKANAMAEQLDDPLLKAWGYNLSGMVRGRLGDLAGAVKDFSASLALADSMGIHVLRLRNHNNWAFVMEVKGRWSEALDHYRALYEVTTTTGMEMEYLSQVETGIGHMLVRLDSLDQGEAVLGRLWSTKAMVGDPYESWFNNAWALLQLRRGRYQQAIASARTAFVTRQLDENDVAKRDASRILSEAYKALNRPAEALEWTEVAHQWEDSVLYRQQASASVKAAFDLEMQLGLEKAVLEREEAKAAIERVRTQRVVLLVVSVLILVIAALLVNRYRLKRRLQIARLRSSLSRDLHDDIGSTLSSISILSNVAGKKAEADKDADAAASFAKISGRSQRLMRDMSDIVWSVDPQKDSLDDLLTRMREFATSVLEGAGIEHRLDFPSDVPALSLPIGTKQNIYLIFKEAMNNAVKHAGAAHVNVRLALESGTLRMEVRDDGAGMDPSAPGNGRSSSSRAVGGGNGLRNMNARAKEVRAELRIESAMGRGTAVVLELPL